MQGKKRRPEDLCRIIGAPDAEKSLVVSSDRIVSRVLDAKGSLFLEGRLSPCPSRLFSYDSRWSSLYHSLSPTRNHRYRIVVTHWRREHGGPVPQSENDEEAASLFFVAVLSIFLLAMGHLMDKYSAIVVVRLIIPWEIGSNATAPCRRHLP
ncbi:MAG TPA: hypothetical protein DCR97_01370 [Deltaproteobacteria bacterium]|nr:hypothetical protein [Deltaproteobacteria bacterium]